MVMLSQHRALQNYVAEGLRLRLTTQGITGLSETYNGVGVQGSLTVFISDGVAVTVDVDGPEGSVAVHADEIDAMTRAISIDVSEVEQ